MSSITKRITVDEIPTLATVREGRLPAVVFIHGNSQSSREFAPLFQSRALTGRHLVSYDLPGHGGSARSTTPAQAYSMDGYCRHLAALLEQLELNHYVLVGLSLGGHIAMQAAAGKFIPEPAALVTIGSPPLGSTADFPSAFRPLPGGISLFKETLPRDEAEVIAASLGLGDGLIPEIIDAILKTDPKARSCLMDNLVTQPLQDECELVTQATIPVKLYFGADDRLINLAYLTEKKLTARLGSRLVFLPDTGHLPDFTDEGRFAGLLSSFLETIDE